MSDDTARDQSLTYAAGWLHWPGGDAPAACGRGGVRRDKREGDGASPAGNFALLSAFYRPDRLALPRTGLMLAPLQPGHWWVDDPRDANYNRLVSLPYPAHGEAMWRQDDLYDIVVVIGYNAFPVVPGAGSAIFLHVARPSPERPARAGRPGIVPTAGCIAVAREVLVRVMALLGPGSTITIRG